ncbi:MAG: NAD(P)H-dependent oxidoreductase [Niastella sp.]|nr:NAD(P)H-dependent oxidoreductase [Niastella sp.]
MQKITIISSSVRQGRMSNRVALYFKNYLKENHQINAGIIDLQEMSLPLLNERLKYLENPPTALLRISEEIKNADGVLIVTPEYNGGYPAALKNMIDGLGEEWYRKPVAIATVSSGAFGASQVLTSLGFTLWKLKALLVPSFFQVAKVQESFTEHGSPVDKSISDKNAANIIKELLWLATITK